MRRLLLMGSSLLLVASGCPGPSGSSEQAKAKPKGQTVTSGPARIACAKPLFDYGKVAQGKTIKHVFVLQNKGGAPLTINRAAGG